MVAFLMDSSNSHCNTTMHPPQFIHTVSSLYSGLSATITAKGWATPCVPLQTGVYQGDPTVALKVARIAVRHYEGPYVHYDGPHVHNEGPHVHYASLHVPCEGSQVHCDGINAPYEGPHVHCGGIYAPCEGIFNTIMCTLIDALKSLKHHGYILSGTQHSVNLLQYADDTCLVSNGPASCQELLNQVDKWLQWSGMKAKVPKCYSLGIQSSSGKLFDPNLTLHNQHIPFIHNNPIKFLDYTVQIPMDNASVKS